jgi:hypothetical protein
MSAPDPPYRQLTFYPSVDLYRRFKSLCRTRDPRVTMTTVLRKLLRDWVESTERVDAATREGSAR